jgi:transposase-like protein
MDAPFPCPFCHSPAVVVAGNSRSFVHYRCEDCAEVWTAQRATPLPAARVVSTQAAAVKRT